MSIIVDGTGKGTRAAVDSENRLKVNAISEDAYVHAAEEGKAFNINTEALPISGTGPFEEQLLYLKNNESSDIEVVGWFIGEKNNRTGGVTDAPILFTMYGSPTAGVGGASGNSVSVVNRRIGDPRVFDFTALSQPGNLTVSGSPLLYQYHYGGRAFGTVNFTIPSGASILLSATFECDSCTLYTGFTGYVRGE
jgi:hypothetical protein